MFKKVTSNTSILFVVVILGLLITLFAEEYFENVIFDYFEGSNIIIAFIIFVIPISFLFGKVFKYLNNYIISNESSRAELIKASEKSAKKRKESKKPNYFGGRCYHCKNWSLELTKESLDIGLFTRECSNCKKFSTIEKLDHAPIPVVLSVILQKADMFATKEQGELSFKIAIIFTIIIIFRHFIILSKPITESNNP